MGRGRPSSNATHTRQALATRDTFTATLNGLKAASSFSYQALSDEIGRPVSTVHGWCTGRHLPYPRDNDVFAQLLRTFGVTETASWMAALTELRTRSSARPTVNPYRGLEPFTENDADIYYGRRELTEHLSTLVNERLATDAAVPLMVIGASGSGKTSLLRAGLQAQLSDQPDVSVTYITPSMSPNANPAQLLNESGRTAERHRDEAAVIILDQFEELFAATVEQGHLEEVVETIDRIGHTAGLTVVIGMRADFFHRAATIPVLLEGLQADPIVVGPMSTDEATDCIVRPANHVGLKVAPNLLVELIDEFAHHVATRGSTEALPLLSHVLYLLAESPDGTELTRDRYQQIGGLSHALGRSADEACTTLTPAEAEACKVLFSNLVELGTDALPTRRIARLSQFTQDKRALDFDSVLAEFASRRLLTIDVDTVTISHEALLTAWPLFTEWINEARESLVMIRRLMSATTAWRDADSDSQSLLRGTLLETGRELLATDARNRLSEDDQLFLEESLAADTERTAHDAQVLARQLSMQATLMRDVDPPLSAQIALVAHSTASTIETRSALLSATSPLPGSRFLGGPGPTALAVSRDGRRAAFNNSVEGTITLLEVSGRSGEDKVRGMFGRAREIQCTPASADVLALALSPNGRLLAVGASEGTIVVVDIDAGDALADGTTCVSMVLDDEQFTADGAVMSVTFNENGTRLFAGGDTKGVGVWEVGAGPTADFIEALPSDGMTMSIAISDNQLLATSTMDGTVMLRTADDANVPAWTADTPPETPASAVALSRDGSLLVGGFRNGAVRVWNVRSATDIHEIELSSAPFASWVNSVAVSDDALFVAAASSDGFVRVWNTSTWHEVRPDLRHPTIVTGVEFGPEQTLITTAEDGAVRIWDLSGAADNDSMDTIWSLTIDDSGNQMLIGTRTNAVLYDLARDPQRMAGIKLALSVNDLVLTGAGCIAPDGSMFVSGTRQGTLILQRAAELNTAAERLDALEGLVEYVTFSADGRVLGAVDDAGHAQLWTIDSSGELSLAGAVDVDPPALGIAFSADGSLLAVSSESSNVHFYDITNVAAPKPLSVMSTGESFAISVAFHPTEPLLAAGNADRSVTLWDCSSPSSPTLVRRLTGPGGHVMALAFDRVGDRLAAGLTDGDVFIWNIADVRNPLLHAKVPSQGSGIYALGFSADGRHLFGAGPHRRINQWILDEADARESIRAAVGDSITAGEWSRFVPTLPYKSPL